MQSGIDCMHQIFSKYAKNQLKTGILAKTRIFCQNYVKLPQIGGYKAYASSLAAPAERH